MPAERTLSEVIRRVRANRNLSQKELGALCHPPRDQPAVARWESGASPLLETTLDVVAEALGVSVRDLLLEGLDASPSAPPEAPAKAPRGRKKKQ